MLLCGMGIGHVKVGNGWGEGRDPVLGAAGFVAPRVTRA